MERIIAKLVDEFEHGKISRRQLIRNLALTATAACASVSAAEAQPASAADGAGFKAIGVNHISYQANDYAQLRDFYSNLLGLKVSNDDGTKCYLSFGDTFIIPRKKPANGIAPRIDHIAYTIDNWNTEMVGAELTRRGLDPKPDTANSFHINDPEGFDVQICSKNMTA
jgi:catechol 2,3-dioxygenase-like lactoylglutathione lyase family enzyme